MASMSAFSCASLSPCAFICSSASGLATFKIFFMTAAMASGFSLSMSSSIFRRRSTGMFPLVIISNRCDADSSLSVDALVSLSSPSKRPLRSAGIVFFSFAAFVVMMVSVLQRVSG